MKELKFLLLVAVGAAVVGFAIGVQVERGQVREKQQETFEETAKRFNLSWAHDPTLESWFASNRAKRAFQPWVYEVLPSDLMVGALFVTKEDECLRIWTGESWFAFEERCKQ